MEQSDIIAKKLLKVLAGLEQFREGLEDAEANIVPESMSKNLTDFWDEAARNTWNIAADDLFAAIHEQSAADIYGALQKMGKYPFWRLIELIDEYAESEVSYESPAFHAALCKLADSDVDMQTLERQLEDEDEDTVWFAHRVIEDHLTGRLMDIYDDAEIEKGLNVETLKDIAAFGMGTKIVESTLFERSPAEHFGVVVCILEHIVHADIPHWETLPAEERMRWNHLAAMAQMSLAYVNEEYWRDEDIPGAGTVDSIPDMLREAAKMFLKDTSGIWSDLSVNIASLLRLDLLNMDDNKKVLLNPFPEVVFYREEAIKEKCAVIAQTREPGVPRETSKDYN